MHSLTDNFECNAASKETMYASCLKTVCEESFVRSNYNDYTLLKEFRLLGDSKVYIFKTSFGNILVTNRLDFKYETWDRIIAFTDFKDKENPQLSEMWINLSATDSVIDFSNHYKIVFPQMHKVASSKHKLWLYILKLLPQKISKLYRMGVPTHLIGRALACNSIAEIKADVLGMKNLHPKLMTMPPTWRKIAIHANLYLPPELLNKLAPLQILKFSKLKARLGYQINFDSVAADILSDKLNAKDFLVAVKYLNLESERSYSKMTKVVEHCYKGIGLGYYFEYPNRQSWLTYKYLYSFIYRKGSSNCTASYDLLLPYQYTR